jgi:outer membrane protein
LNEAHELVSVNQRNVDNRNSQLELARARFKSGIGGPDDVLTAQTAKGNAVISLIQAQNTEDSARESLLETLGLDAQEKVQFQVSIPQAIEGGGYEAWVEQALSKRPEILRAKSAIDAASYGAKAASTTSAPSLSTTISWSSNDPGFPAGAPGYGIGFILSVPVFDGERASGARKEANATLKAAKSELVNAQLQVKTDVSQAYLGVQSAEQQVEAAQTNVANAKESLRIAEGRYKSGLGLFLDIINAQTALLSAETNSVVATAELSRQRASLRKAIAALEP